MRLTFRIVASLLALATACTPAAPAATADSYQWLAPEHTAELGARITAAGPTASLEVREDKAGLHFRVVVPGARLAPVADLNNSFICPPRCP